MKRARRSSGFVLVMVLMTLVVAGTLLTIAARRSCRQSLLAAQAERELQLRWAVRSVQDRFLEHAEEVLGLEAAKTGGSEGVVSATRSLTLGGVEFHVLLSDEQAKANVNTLAEHKDLAGLEVALRDLATGQSHLLPVRLRPEPPVKGWMDSWGPYAALEEVFAFEHPSELVNPGGDGTSALERVTCWSDGRVNFKRAHPAVLREMLEGILSATEVEGLLRCRRESPDCTLTEALGSLQLNVERLDKARWALTDVSSCHSVWVVARGRTRDWYYLTVAQNANALRGVMRASFVW